MSDDEEHEKNVEELLALFIALLESIQQGDGEWDALEEMMSKRAYHLITGAFDAYGVTLEEAIELIASTDKLTPEEEAKRKSLYAAVDNLADFAVAEEYQMTEELMDVIEEFGADTDKESDEEPNYWQAAMGVFYKYNDRYAKTEDSDVKYAMIMAAFLAAKRNETVLMYMTMQDERVRPWHRQFEGFTAPKSQFPEWLIPPIEHMCRCYLIEDSAVDIENILAQATPEMPAWFNRTFKESVAMGGRIFSDEHPYFQVDENHVGRLNVIAERIKNGLFE